MDLVKAVREADLSRSYLDFHATGLNYACLHWSEGFVLKVYELPCTKGEPIVAPHQHRYSFSQHVLCGAILNCVYEETEPSSISPSFACVYDTPLNGGFGGWKPIRVASLMLVKTPRLYAGDSYILRSDEIHTIGAYENTWVFTVQGPDVNSNALTYFGSQSVISTRNDLYRKPTSKDMKEMADRLEAALEAETKTSP